jgi:hypothetical protein
MLSKVGIPEGIEYLNGGSGASFSKNSLKGVRFEKDWTFSFQGARPQLLKQLDLLRIEVEGQLTSCECSISGRGRWVGDFSGFSFEYSSRGLRGFIRVTGVSFESGSQGLEILAYER